VIASARQRLDKLDLDLLWETSVRETPVLLRMVERLLDHTPGLRIAARFSGPNARRARLMTNAGGALPWSASAIAGKSWRGNGTELVKSASGCPGAAGCYPAPRDTGSRGD